MNIKKRIICNFLCFLMVLCSVFTLTSCKKDCKHEWGSYEVITQATCTEAGQKQRKCSKCNKIEDATIDALGHSYGEWVEGVLATCQTTGTKAHKDCTVCGKHFDANNSEISDLTIAVDANAHNYGEWVSNGDGTHTRVCLDNSEHKETANCEGGNATCKEKAKCSICNAEYGDYGEHSYGEWIDEVPATCQTTGTKAHKDCLICEKHFDANNAEISDLTIAIDADAHVMATSVIEPTCVNQGYTRHYCKEENCGYSYNDTFVNANGHSWVGTVTCTTGRECENCDETEPELGHDCVFEQLIEATCETATIEKYGCTRCDYEYTNTIGEPKQHNITGVEPTEKQLDSCKYQLVYICKENGCGKEVLGDVVYHHVLKATISQEATCMRDGEKLLSCENCDYTEREVILKNNDGHIFDDGTLDESTNIRTFHCVNTGLNNEQCTFTKTVLDASHTNSAGVNSSDLGLANGGVKLGNAELTFDNTALGSLADKDLTISSEVLSGEDLDNALAKLSEEQRKQLAMVSGQNPIIYNFTVADNNNAGSLIETFDDGYITITLPYVLGEDEDVDSIAVWYISGGMPVSIKAQYSNGYITFKTNHFSEYTVTRLTPKERCNLYGCVLKETVFEGDCVRDGYILKICIRCHETTKEITKKATGHNYLETEEKATCEKNGKVTYSCTNCDHYYSKLLLKTGHNYEEIERQNPTCTQVGYIKYACTHENCDKTKTVKLPELLHNIQETFVPATCEKGGYNHYECSNCDYEYDVVVSPARGHQYTISYIWANDYSSAKIVFTCSFNNNHVIEKDLQIEITTIPSTCVENGKIIYKASIYIEGVEYKDTKEVILDKLPHTFGDELKYSDTKHWKECSCGEKAEISDHNFDDGEILLNPTCMEEGEIKYTCHCGYEKIEKIQPTYEHNYVNGVCTVCGNKETDCDHSTLEEKTIDLGEHGSCSAVLKYKTCRCGKVVIVDGESISHLKCNIDNESEPTTGEDAEGTFSFNKGVCKTCGLKIQAKIYESDSKDCKKVMKMYYTITCTDGTTLNAYSEVEYYNHRYNYKIISLKDYSKCGTTIEVNQCLDCNEILRVNNINLNCDGTQSESQIIDKDNHLHHITTLTCNDCGLVYIYDTYEEIFSVCENTDYIKITITKDNEIIFNCEYEENNTNHEYETTYTKLGETCEDGVLVSVKCKKCGSEHSYTTYQHDLCEDRILNLSDLDCCNGEIYYRVCKLCDTIVDFITYNGICDFYGQEGITETVVIDGIEHKIITKTCSKCGFVWIMDETIIKRDGCEVTKTSVDSFKLNDNLIFNCSRTYNTEEHDYEKTIIKGDCENGYTLEVRCKNCDYSYQYDRKGHDIVEEKLVFEDCCNLEIHTAKCSICNKDLIDNFRFDSNCLFDYENNEYNDSLGISHYTNKATCKVCGLIIEMDYWSVQKSVCIRENYSKIKMTFKGEVIFENQFERDEVNHTLNYTYNIEAGKTCEDEYEVIEYCTHCDYRNTYLDRGHKFEDCEENLSEDNTCDVRIHLIRCVICNKIIDIDLSSSIFCEHNEESTKVVGDDGLTHTILEFTCARCGKHYKFDEWSVSGEDCNVTVYISIKITNSDNKTLFDATISENKSEHSLVYNYKFKSDSHNCEDGYQVIVSCRNCSYSDSYYNYSHITETNVIHLSDYGLCGGEYIEEKCKACEKIISSNLFEYCNWRLVESNNNTYYKYYCEACKKYKTEEKTIGQKDDNCICEETTLITYYSEAGEKLISLSNSFHYTSHNYVYSAKLKGETCEDGYILIGKCSDCGYSYTSENNSHYPVIPTEFSFDNYENLCGGKVELLKCPCGIISTLIFDKLLCNFEYYKSEEIDGNIYYFEKCRNCGLIKGYCDYETMEDCKNLHCQNYKFLISKDNDSSYETLLEIRTVIDLRENHNYNIDRIELKGDSCEDGFKVYRVCSVCGKEDVYENNYHEIFDFVLVNLSEYGCDAKIINNGCACGDIINIHLDDKCGYDYNYRTVEEDGVDYNINSYSCSTHKIEIEVKFYRIIENCKGVNTYVITVKQNNNEVFEKTLNSKEFDAHIYEYSFVLNGDTCSDGYDVIGTCINCGKTTETRHEYNHGTYCVKYYDLKEYGACGGSIQILRCACGEYEDVSRDFICRFNESDSRADENGVYSIIRTCEKCNLIEETSIYDLLEDCKVYNCEEFTIKIGDTIIIDSYVIKNFMYDKHDEKITYKLLGETCNDGVEVTYTCSGCGQTRTETIFGHDYIINESYDLSEYGDCEGTFEFVKCACGKYQNTKMNFNWDNHNNSSYVENDVKHNVETYTCDLCGLRYEDNSYVEFNQQQCTATKYHNIYLVVGSLVVEKSYSETYIQHTIKVISRFLTDEEDCEKGVEIIDYCEYCNYSEGKTLYHHYQYEKELIDLSQYGSVCGGYVRYLSCACGEESDIYLNNVDCEFDTKDTDMWFDEYIKDTYNRPYSARIYTCAVTDPTQCGFKIRMASYFVEYDNLCYDIGYQKWQFGYNDVDNTYKYELIIRTGVGTNHKYVEKTKKEDTDDGGYVEIFSHLCKNCNLGYIEKRYYNSEGLLYKEERFHYDYDYDNPGKIACKMSVYEYLYHENSKGENIQYFTRKYEAKLIEGEIITFDEVVLTYDFDYKAPFGTDSYIVYTTENDNYGNTVEREERMTYFEYEYRNNFGEYDDYQGENIYKLYEYSLVNKGKSNEYWGLTERSYRFDIATDYGVTGHEIILTRKNSESNNSKVTFAEFYYSLDDKNIYSTNNWHTLYKHQINNFETDNETFEKYEYTYDFNYNAPFGVMSHAYTEKYTNSDGEDRKTSIAITKIKSQKYSYNYYNYVLYEYITNFEGTDRETWQKTDYTYSFDTGCKRTTVYKDSTGVESTTTEDCHKELIYASKNIKDPTCSQEGEGSMICEICKMHQKSYVIEPTAHNWVYNSEDGKYHCSTCGLKNSNGASGEIIMEDFTEKYGEDTNYVIGYHNRNGVKFTYYVSLINPETDEEIILENMTFITDYDDIVAIGFSIEDVKTFANEKGLDLTNYNVKFTFVPEGGDSNFDYAITFDKLA